jgi:putative oxidoreductase
MMKNLLFCRCGPATANWGPTILRVVVGAIFVFHGWQKLSGGISGVGGFFGSLGVPAPMFFAYVVTWVELLGGIALILGFLSSLATFLLAIDMVAATFLVHLPKGFYASGGELVLLLLAAVVTLGLVGPGRWALDDKIRKQS